MRDQKTWLEQITSQLIEKLDGMGTEEARKDRYAYVLKRLSDQVLPEEKALPPKEAAGRKKEK